MRWDRDSVQELKYLRKRGLTQTEIAKKLNITKDSVKMKLCKLGKSGQLKLREHIHDDTFTFDDIDKETLTKALVIWLCEGTRYVPSGTRNRVEVVNSDPRIVYLFVTFLRKLRVNEKKIKLRLKIPEENEDGAKRFWSRLLGMPHSSFEISARPSGLKNKTSKYQYGTLTVKYNSRKLAYELHNRAEQLIKLT
jgi:transcriptional regulator with XRE-family HTH domain